jgi:hypothetical protein
MTETCHECGRVWTNDEIRKAFDTTKSMRIPGLMKQVLIHCTCGRMDFVFEERVVNAGTTNTTK